MGGLEWLLGGGGLVTLLATAGKGWSAWKAREDRLRKEAEERIDEINQRHAEELAALNEEHKADLRAWYGQLSAIEKTQRRLRRSTDDSSG